MTNSSRVVGKGRDISFELHHKLLGHVSTFELYHTPLNFKLLLNYSCFVVLGLNCLGGRKFVCIPGLARVVICNSWAW